MHLATMIDITHCCKKLAISYSMSTNSGKKPEKELDAIPLLDLRLHLIENYRYLDIVLQKNDIDVYTMLALVEKQYSHLLKGWCFTFMPLNSLRKFAGYIDISIGKYRKYPYDATMFVVYPYVNKGYLLSKQEQKERRQNIVEKQRLNRLSVEMNNLFKSLRPTAHTLRAHEFLEYYIENVLDVNWPDMDYTVCRFGSSASDLLIEGSDLDLCIVSAKDQQLIDQQPKGRNWGNPGWSRRYGRNSVFNIKRLESILVKQAGMRNVHAIESALVPICEFLDPRTDTKCDITVHNTLAIENSKLIKEYTLLDPRIRPLVYMLKYFTKQRSINSSRGGTLSSYTYILMCLYYLIHLDKPVIPNLQHLPVRCISYSCSVNYQQKRNVKKRFLYRDKVTELDVFYHDCVKIVKDNQQRQYSPDITEWYSQNYTSLAALLIGFFDYYTSFDFNNKSLGFTPRSIKNGKNKFPHNTLVVYDPFLEDRNVAHGCTKMGWERIQYEFERASRMMNNGASFKDVCSKFVIPPNYYDPDSIENRYAR